MDKTDREWYLKCRAEPKRYEIVFDGSATIVLNKETNSKDHTFLHNGKDFVLDVLKACGIKYYLM